MSSGMELKRTVFSRLRVASALLGVGLLIVAVTLFASTLLGIFELDSFALSGQSGLRTLASLGVGGCLLAAIGYYDE